MLQRILFVGAFALLAFAANAADIKPVCGPDLALPMEVERTGHVSVRVTLNGIPTRLLVDTGANVNTLDTAQGQQFKYELLLGSERKAGEGRAKLSVSVGTTDFGSHEFSVHDLGFINIPSKRYGTEPFAGQLGAQFFVDSKARIDFAGMVVCLQAPTAK